MRVKTTPKRVKTTHNLIGKIGKPLLFQANCVLAFALLKVLQIELTAAINPKKIAGCYQSNQTKN